MILSGELDKRDVEEFFRQRPEFNPVVLNLLVEYDIAVSELDTINYYFQAYSDQHLLNLMLNEKLIMAAAVYSPDHAVEYVESLWYKTKFFEDCKELCRLKSWEDLYQHVVHDIDIEALLL